VPVCTTTPPYKARPRGFLQRAEPAEIVPRHGGGRFHFNAHNRPVAPLQNQVNLSPGGVAKVENLDRCFRPTSLLQEFGRDQVLQDGSKPCPVMPERRRRGVCQMSRQPAVGDERLRGLGCSRCPIG